MHHLTGLSAVVVARPLAHAGSPAGARGLRRAASTADLPSTLPVAPRTRLRARRVSLRSSQLTLPPGAGRGCGGRHRRGGAAAGYAGVPFCEGDLVDAHRKRGCDGHAARLFVGMAAGFRGRSTPSGSCRQAPARSAGRQRGRYCKRDSLLKQGALRSTLHRHGMIVGRLTVARCSCRQA